MKHAVITGGAAGLGADVARTLSEAGYRIGIFDLGAERVAEAASQLENAVGIEADVTSPDQVAAAFDAFGEVPDLLVNNAGIVRFGAMEEQSVQDYIDVVNVNLLGSCFCARAIAQYDLAAAHFVGAAGLYRKSGRNDLAAHCIRDGRSMLSAIEEAEADFNSAKSRMAGLLPANSAGSQSAAATGGVISRQAGFTNSFVNGFAFTLPVIS